MREVEASAKRVIPEARLSQVTERFARAIKTAERLGFPVPVLKVGERQRRRIHRSDAAWYGEVEREVIPVLYGGEGSRSRMRSHDAVQYFAWEVEVEVEGGLPVLPGGWRLLAAVDRSCGDEAVVRSAPGAPAGLRALIRQDSQCDHCETSRARNTTFLVQDEAGNVKSVGSGCLADFIGHLGCTPESILSFLEALALDTDGEEEEGYTRERFQPHLPIESVLTAAITCIDLHGWVSRQRAMNGPINGPCATSTDVLYGFVLRDGDPTEEVRREYERMDARRASPSVVEEARAIISWLSALPDNASDYELNLRALARNGVAHAFKHLGLACSGVVAYRRAHDMALSEHDANKAQAIPLLNEYGADVGTKLVDLRLRLVDRPRAFTGTYGTTYLCKFEDESRRTYQWWATGVDPTQEDDLSASRARLEIRDRVWAQITEEAKAKWGDPTSMNAREYRDWSTQRHAEITEEMLAAADPAARRTTNGYPVWDVGAWMYLTGSVKKHDEFKGLRITVLTRCGWRVDPTPPKARKTRAKKGAVAEPPAAS
ncbi:MAG: hypothetical protein IPH13_20100 [Planctomycetes bacterium]|nr:hypothetical protein [Planctomycetota bacterium]